MQRIPDSSNEELEKSIRKQFDKGISKANIREDLQFRIIKTHSFTEAKGINFLKLGKSHILLSPNLLKTDENAFSVAVKYELSHIKSNDAFILNGIGLVSYLAIRFFAKEKISKSFIASYLCYYFLPVIPMILFLRYREQKADEFAISNSSNEEIEAGLYLFEAFDQVNKIRNPFPFFTAFFFGATYRPFSSSF